MDSWSMTLIGIGLTCVAISLACSRHSPASPDFIAVHKRMDDARIRSQLKKGRWRVDAKLGIQFGVVFVILGLVWQRFLSAYWF